MPLALVPVPHKTGFSRTCPSGPPMCKTSLSSSSDSSSAPQLFPDEGQQLCLLSSCGVPGLQGSHSWTWSSVASEMAPPLAPSRQGMQGACIPSSLRSASAGRVPAPPSPATPSRVSPRFDQGLLLLASPGETTGGGEFLRWGARHFLDPLTQPSPPLLCRKEIEEAKTL